MEALVSRRGQDLIVEWTRDSAFRFFPLVEENDLGLTLHPFDLATNKVLGARRSARFLVAATFGAAWAVTGDGVCAVLAFVSALRAFGPDAPERHSAVSDKLNMCRASTS